MPLLCPCFLRLLAFKVFRMNKKVWDQWEISLVAWYVFLIVDENINWNFARSVYDDIYLAFFYFYSIYFLCFIVFSCVVLGQPLRAKGSTNVALTFLWHSIQTDNTSCPFWPSPPRIFFTFGIQVGPIVKPSGAKNSFSAPPGERRWPPEVLRPFCLPVDTTLRRHICGTTGPILVSKKITWNYMYFSLSNTGRFDILINQWSLKS